MAATQVTVYVISGQYRSSGARVDLGKFFTQADAQKHVDRFATGWHNVTIEARQESQ